MKVLIAITYMRQFNHVVLHDLMLYLGEAPERTTLAGRSVLFRSSDVQVVLVRNISDLHGLRVAIAGNATTFSYWIDGEFAMRHRTQLYELERYLTHALNARLYMQLRDFVIANISAPLRVYYLYFTGAEATRSLAVNALTKANHIIPWVHIASSDRLLETINSELQIGVADSRINWNFYGLLHDPSIINPSLVVISDNACKLQGMPHKHIAEVDDPLMSTEYLWRASRYINARINRLY